MEVHSAPFWNSMPKDDAPWNTTRPACGAIRPIIVLSSVLLPEPLSPTIAKISPSPICDADAGLHRVRPVADGDDRRAKSRSDLERVRADGEHGIEGDHADDRAHDRRGGRGSDARRAARRAQAVMAADQRHESAEDERLERADREMRASDRVLRLRHVGGRRHVQDRHATTAMPPSSAKAQP